MGSFIDIPAGQVFGRLTFVDRVKVGRSLKCRCRCSCGAETIVNVSKLRSGVTKSCGCLRHNTGEEAAAFRHGHAVGRTRTSTYRIWANILDRCTRQNHVEWRNYGGRGITVCERWFDFKHFLEDMGERPSPQHSIDRVNNDKGYSPDNCRWATAKEQMRNTRANDFINVDGENVCQKDAAAVIGVSRGRMKRLAERGFIITKKDAEFLKRVHMHGTLITFRGKTQSITHWAEETGISRNAIYKRLGRGWPVERALTEH